jgi:hypothetical protein
MKYPAQPGLTADLEGFVLLLGAVCEAMSIIYGCHPG